MNQQDNYIGIVANYPDVGLLVIACSWRNSKQGMYDDDIGFLQNLRS